MMDPYDRFELLLNDRVVKTPIALASMAGMVDAGYVLERSEHVGAAFIGGYSIDEPTIAASRVMAEDGRKEFLSDDPIEEIGRQLLLLNDSDVVAGVNLRGSSPDSFRAVSERFGDRVIYEIDAHCRQPSMIGAGCGESLLQHPEALAAVIEGLKSDGVTVSVKIRAGVAKNDQDLARTIWKAEADIIHVDLMDFGHAKLRQIRNSCPLTIIANNGITTFARVKEMFSHGADLVSLARHADPATLARLDTAIAELADDVGWYNAPKQLCRGGDIRAFCFCCMPVKDCPLLPALRRIGMERSEFIVMKQEGVMNTPLVHGEHTCFGSLAWCCKSSTPCMFRDMTLGKLGLTKQDYMRYKHRLSDTIMARVFCDENRDDAS
ncbi:MAG: methanogenesis marker 9 domain-containing protein [Methanomicrobiaceae archaeon]|nr:methanogenesis marker 9 domain-containing protein [Methanomicrobiaceae archaeon]